MPCSVICVRKDIQVCCRLSLSLPPTYTHVYNFYIYIYISQNSETKGHLAPNNIMTFKICNLIPLIFDRDTVF